MAVYKCEETIEKLARLEKNLAEILPDAIRQFREAQDPIDANRPVFPPTFWSRRA